MSSVPFPYREQCDGNTTQRLYRAGGFPPEELDELFPRVRHLTEPESLVQTGGPVEMFIGMDHVDLMPVQVVESMTCDSQLRIMRPLFGHQYILVGTGGPRIL